MIGMGSGTARQKSQKFLKDTEGHKKGDACVVCVCVCVCVCVWWGYMCVGCVYMCVWCVLCLLFAVTHNTSFCEYSLIPDRSIKEVMVLVPPACLFVCLQDYAKT